MEGKRGRKSKTAIFDQKNDEKPKEDNNLFGASIEKAPKKRGRPKTKNLDGSTQSKGTGKRGRKPKERVYAHIETSANPFEGEGNDSDSDNEALILQIPHDNDSKISISYEDEPAPFDNPRPRFSIYDKQSLSEIQTRIENLPSKLEDIEKEREKEAKKYIKFLSTKDVSTSFPVQELLKKNQYEPKEYKEYDDTPFKKENPEKNEVLSSKDKDILFQKRSNYVDKYTNKYEAKLAYTSEYSLLPEFKHSAVTGKLPTSTTYCCWWDTYPFDTQPVCYPIKNIVDNTFEMYILNSNYKSISETFKIKNYNEYPTSKFLVTGCFCSYNCALAYIKNSKNIPSNTEQLLHCMYKEIHKQTFKIKPAPPYQALERFGGPLSIKNFRESFDKVDYKLLKTPLMSVLPSLEENENFINNNYSDQSTSINVPNTFSTTQNKNDGTLRLKRSKPLKGSKGTLENFMNIQII